MDLRTVTNMLLRAPDPARLLKLADTYMQAYNRVPDQFILPAEHAQLGPIIEAFAYDTTAFAEYIRALRDGSTGGAYDDLHDLYRTISLRAIQVARRTRIRKAVMLLLPKAEKDLGCELPYDDQLRIARFIEKRWGAMRLDCMADDRRLRKSARLSAEERTVSLGGFWSDIDKKLGAGVVDLGGDEHYQELLDFIRKP